MKKSIVAATVLLSSALVFTGCMDRTGVARTDKNNIRSQMVRPNAITNDTYTGRTTRGLNRSDIGPRTLGYNTTPFPYAGTNNRFGIGPDNVNNNGFFDGTFNRNYNGVRGLGVNDNRTLDGRWGTAFGANMFGGQGISSAIERQLALNGFNKATVLVLGDAVVVGLRQGNLTNGNNVTRGTINRKAGVMNSRNVITRRNINTGSLGLGMNRTAGSRRANVVSPNSDVIASVQQQLGNNTQVLVVTDPEAVNVMDRVDRNLKNYDTKDSGVVASDIRFILSRAKNVSNRNINTNLNNRMNNLNTVR